MKIGELIVENVRIIRKTELAPSRGANLIIGPNASGKTSLLEAIHIVATGRSFRSRHIEHVIRKDAEALSVALQCDDTTGGSTRLGVRRGRDAVEIRRDGEPVTGFSTLARALPLVVLTPESHYQFHRSSRERRAALDWALFHVEPRFHDSWRRYHRGLKQRNAALKTARSPGAAAHAWDAAMADAAVDIDDLRQAYVDRWNAAIEPVSKDLLGDVDLALRLHRGWHRDQDLLEVWRRDYSQDRESGYTHSGPHRADLAIRLAGAPVREMGSQGQQKLVLIALKLAQLQIAANDEHHPIVLIDDLAAELDSYRRAQVMGVLARMGVQLFVSSTTNERLATEPWPEQRVFHVEHGIFEAA